MREDKEVCDFKSCQFLNLLFTKFFNSCNWETVFILSSTVVTISIYIYTCKPCFDLNLSKYVWNSHIILPFVYGYELHSENYAEYSCLANRGSNRNRVLPTRSPRNSRRDRKRNRECFDRNCRIERSNDLNANIFNINPHLFERVIREGIEDYIVAQSSIARNSFEILVDRRKTTIDGKPSAIYRSVAVLRVHARMKEYWKRFRFKIYR